jgi:hypothetical protein
MDGVKQQDSTPQNDSTLGFKWIKKSHKILCSHNVKTPAPPFFQNNLTFVIQMLINVFPPIVFVRTFFLYISRESNNYILFLFNYICIDLLKNYKFY